MRQRQPSRSQAQLDLTNLVKKVKKRAPEFSFPHTSHRIFAENKYKTLVPSPDTYFKQASAVN